MQRIGIRKKAAHIVAVLALALMLGGVIAPIARAGDSSSDHYIQYMIDQWADICRQNGGTPSVHLILDGNGSYGAATVNCFGQTGSWGKSWACSIDYTGYWNCFPGFTQPPPTVWNVAAPNGSVSEAYDEGPTPTPVVVQQAEGRPDAPIRPESTPTPEPAEREGR